MGRERRRILGGGRQEYIGFDAESLAYIKDFTVSSRRPGLSSVTDALVAPFRPSKGGNPLQDLEGGVFDGRGRLVEASAQPRSDGCQAVLLAQNVVLPSNCQRLPEAVFGGLAFDHFGHFLLEGTARLWALPMFRHLPWLFLTNGKPNLEPYQLGFLRLLGLASEQIVAVSDWVEVESLVIPEPAFVYHHHATHAYRDIFRRADIDRKTNITRTRIYVSRADTRVARTVGERELEEVLARDGWRIVVPELLEPAEQAALFAENEVVAGLQGSAMHLGLFAPPGRRVIHFCRGTAYRGYYLLDALMQADASYLAAMSSHALRSKPIAGPFLLDLDRTIKFLRENGLLLAAPLAAVLHDSTSTRHQNHPGVTLDTQYCAWWHFTESQIRFHRGLADDGTTVNPDAALAPALESLKIWPDNPEIFGHALALVLKFEGAPAAATLLDERRHWDAGGVTVANAQICYIESLISDTNGEYARALDAATRANEQQPANETYATQRATMLFRLGRYEDASKVLGPLERQGAALAGTYNLLSCIAEARQDAQAAIAHTRRAMLLDPSDSDLCLRLANLLAIQGQGEEALRLLRAYAASNERLSGPLLLTLADFEAAHGMPEAALRHEADAYQREPGNAAFRDRYVAGLTRSGCFPDLSASVDRDPADDVSCSFAVYRESLKLASGDGPICEAALRAASDAVTLNPDNAVMMQNLLDFLIRAERTQEAALLAQMAIERGMEQGGIYYVQSLIEAKLDRHEAARKAACHAAALSPSNAVITEHFSRFCIADQG